MNRKLAAVLISALALVGGAAADEGELRKVEGAITRVEPSAKAITVRTGEPPRRLKFFLARDGRVTSGGRPVRVAELERGERVEISYTEVNAHRWAHAIAVVGGGPGVERAAE